jgi:tRNA nucleotidyltransferase (CCA-adding enzyme)
MGMKQILEDVLKEITLSRDEFFRFEKIARDFIRLIDGVGIGSFIGGSFAKETVVKTDGKQDLDIFVVFDSAKELNCFESTLKKFDLPGPLKKVHGSRDYFNIDCGDVILEVIPVMKNLKPEEAENVTDVSLSHVGYIRTEIKKNPRLSNEIKLAKRFCAANNVYGAESYIGGFSGYSIEILVSYFGGFIKFLKGIGKLQVIDPSKFFRTKKEIIRELNSAKLNSPIILVDPTFKDRNATAGLSYETFDKFLKVTQAFLKSPSKEFFEKKELDVDSMKKFANENEFLFFQMKLETKKQEGDIAGTKMKKFFDFFVSELVRKGQNVMRKEFDYPGKGFVANGHLVIDENREVEVRGPSIDKIEIIKKFKKAKNGNEVFEKGGFWWFVDTVSVKDVFESVRKFSKEMDVKVF